MTWELEIARGGNCARLRAPYRPHPIQRKPRRTRGAIRGFSAASRRRLQMLLHSLDQAAEGLPLFVTLTYPGAVEWTTLPRERFKRDLDGFCKRLQRHTPGAHGIWKVEPQKRGEPHYHLLI